MLFMLLDQDLKNLFMIAYHLDFWVKIKSIILVIIVFLSSLLWCLSYRGPWVKLHHLVILTGISLL